MAVIGGGIPRLQELSFLEVAILGVSTGAGFEDIRRRLVDHMIALRENTPASGNIATFRLALDNPKRYVSNATEALKELMRLGLVVQAPLPSSANAARSYRRTTFSLTAEGETWATLLQEEPRMAYDALLNMLWKMHPQFPAFVAAVQEGLTIPLAQWGELRQPRSRDCYVDFLVDRVVDGLQSESAGWAATTEEVRQAINGYLKARYESAESRGRPDPYPRNQDFIRGCEEALVKFAFTQRGTPIDYISQEILRRWTKDLGIANFSYHVPGRNALRFWSTADVTESADSVSVRRRVGGDFGDRVLNHLGASYERVRRDDDTRSLWVPIHRVRAEICFRLRIPDAAFDRALIEFLSGSRGGHLPFRVNVDPAIYGSVPPSELPLRVPSQRGVRTYYSMSLVPNRRGGPAPTESSTPATERSFR
jgi:hypothetical protein